MAFMVWRRRRLEEWEIFFIEEVEFDPDLKGWLTCVWSKGRGGAGDGHSAIPSFSRSVWNLSCVLGTVLWTRQRVESKIRFLPLWNLHSSGRSNKQVNTSWKIWCQRVMSCENRNDQRQGNYRVLVTALLILWMTCFACDMPGEMLMI